MMESLETTNCALCGHHENREDHGAPPLVTEGDSWDQRELKSESLEPIAVVGLSFRFPQAATSTEAFWEMMIKKRCAMTKFPKDRWNQEAFYHPDPNRYDSFAVEGGHFMEGDLGAFDTHFFQISQEEAIAMDPHQRILLETVYKAFENGGFPMESLRGSKTSVHTASFADDYRLGVFRDPDLIPNYCATGTEAALLANRISWFFDLHGASTNLDSACSASLTAIDHACSTLRNGDAEMSVVTGGSLVLDPENISSLCKVGFLSPNGRCYSFDSRGNGYAKGEGVGVVLLERLSDALKKGHVVRAVIRSSNCNQDGHTPGITQPDQHSQQSLIRDTYRKAGLEMGTTRFFEAHGTGTALGDPTEARAIGAAFADCDRKEPLYVGAVKANIGHLEGGSGMAGLIKTILVLESGVIPPNANFEQCNPRINRAALNIEFPLEPTPWPTDGLRRASINSFGFGGSNAHAIVDDAYNFCRLRGLNVSHRTRPMPPTIEELRRPEIAMNFFDITRSTNPEVRDRGSYKDTSELFGSIPNKSNKVINGTNLVNGHTETGISKIESNSLDQDSKVDDGEKCPELLVWSAADRKGIARIAEKFRAYYSKALSRAPDEGEFIMDLANTLSRHRSLLSWRSFSLCSSIEDLSDLASQLSAPTRSVTQPNLCFIFTGQGAQWSQMGRQLCMYSPFLASLQRSQSILKLLGCQWILLDEMYNEKDPSRIHQAEISQPICTALQIALVDLLKSVSVHAAIVIGHSSGEIAAAYYTGAISHQAALKIAFYRGKVVSGLTISKHNSGAMMAVGLAAEEIEPYFTELKDQHGECKVQIGCFNSPKSLTLSGDNHQIDELKNLLDQKRIFAQKLRVNVAYHSSQMLNVVSEYLNCLGKIETGNLMEPKSTMISTLTGSVIASHKLQDAKYWGANLTSPVRFSQALALVCSRTKKTLPKIGVSSSANTPPIHFLLEVGPHSALKGPTREAMRALPKSVNIEYGSLLVRGASAGQSFLAALGALFCTGFGIDFEALRRFRQEKHGYKPKLLTDLPEYPFEHSHSFWFQTRLDKGYRMREERRHELLGRPALDWNPFNATWRNFLRPSELPWINHHKINGSVLYPGPGMLVMAIEAMNQLISKDGAVSGFELRDVNFQKSLVIPEEGIETSVTLRSLRDHLNAVSQWREFTLYSFETEKWVHNCRGYIKVDNQGKVGTDPPSVERDSNINSISAFEKTSDACQSTIDSREFYSLLRDCGINYGPSFQRLKNISWAKDQDATANVDIFQEPEGPYKQWAAPHVVHPTTLDAIAHSMFIGLTNGGTCAMPTNIPSKIRRVWLSRHGLNYFDANSVHVTSRALQVGARAMESSVTVLSRETAETLLSMTGLETIIVAEAPSSALSPEEEEKLYFNIEYKPDIAVLGLERLKKLCTEEVPEDEPVEFFSDLHKFMMAVISQTIATLHGSKSDVSAPHLRKYISWMKMHVGNETSESTRAYKTLQDDPVLLQELGEKLTRHSSRGRLFVEVGLHLTAVIEGTTNFHQQMFSNGLVEDFYLEVFRKSKLHGVLIRYLDLLVHRNPGMNIIELGGGTGGLTDLMLEALTRKAKEGSTRKFCKYDFTDISYYFLHAAAEKFKDLSRCMNFFIFSVDKESEDQDVEMGGYDLVLAYTVLHLAENLGTAIRRIRKLLKPGGKLIMTEITRPETTRGGFVWGLFPDWWQGHESDRMWGPCVSETRWGELLASNGFSGADLIFRDNYHEDCHEMSMIISTAVEQTALTPSLPQTSVLPIVIVLDPLSLAQCELASRSKRLLESRGYSNCTLRQLSELINPSVLQHVFYISLLELESSILANLDEQNYYVLKSFLSSANKLLWISGAGGALDAASSALGAANGLFRVLQTENYNKKLVTMVLDRIEIGTPHTLEHIHDVVQEMTQTINLDELEHEYIEYGGILNVPRLVEANGLKKKMEDLQFREKSQRQAIEDWNLKFEITSLGSPSLLRLVETESGSIPLQDSEIEVKVSAAGISLADVLSSTGRLNQKWLGSECTGIVTECGRQSEFGVGDSVIIYGTNLLQTRVRVDSKWAVRKPQNLTYPEAASFPSAYTLAYYALVCIGRVKRGDTVLIHCASGAVGQGAIQICKYFGASVLATVGSAEKKQHIQDLDLLTKDAILNSRNGSFKNDVMRLTEGRGVNIVLDPFPDERSDASWDCLSLLGCFLDISQGNSSGSKVPRTGLPNKNISYSRIDLASMMPFQSDLIRESFVKVSTLVSEEALQVPGPVRDFPASKADEAFRSLQNGDQVGKAVLSFAKNDIVQMELKPRTTNIFQPNSTYLISGGLGGLGRSIAKWMIDRGARHLLLLSRSGATSEQSKQFLKELESLGARVQAPACDIGEQAALRSALEKCRAEFPPFKGCILAAVVLRDAVFENMEFEQWKSVTQPKIQGTWNLHELLPKGMDFFITLSSMIGIFGNGSQANYAAGSTYQDALVRYRVANGERAASLDLGPFQDIGKLVESVEMRTRVEQTNHFTMLSSEDLYSMLEYYCAAQQTQPSPAAAQRDSQAVSGIKSPAQIRERNHEEPAWMRRPLFRHLHQIEGAGLADASSDGSLQNPAANLSKTLASAASLADAGLLVTEALIKRLAMILATAVENFDAQKSMQSYGMDSLIAVGVRNWFATEVKADIAIFDIMGSASMESIGAMAATRSPYFKEAS